MLFGTSYWITHRGGAFTVRRYYNFVLLLRSYAAYRPSDARCNTITTNRTRRPPKPIKKIVRRKCIDTESD